VKKLVTKGIRNLRQIVYDVRGMTLIEVLVALAILSATAIPFLSATEIFNDRATLIQERATAENMAKSQLESVSIQDYDDANDPPQYQKLTGTSAGYYIDLSAVRLDPKNDGTGTDDGIQKITVKIYKGSDANGRLLLTLEGYKLAP
jgi:type II secretion system protein I